MYGGVKSSTSAFSKGTPSKIEKKKSKPISPTTKKLIIYAHKYQLCTKVYVHANKQVCDIQYINNLYLKCKQTNKQSQATTIHITTLCSERSGARLKRQSVAKVHSALVISIVFRPEPRDVYGGQVGVPRAVETIVAGRPFKVVVGGGERMDAAAQSDVGQHQNIICVRVGVHGDSIGLS